jgi:hypothetical protein
MEQSNTIGIFLTGIAALLTAILAVYRELRRIKSDVKLNTKLTATTHEIVNSQRDTMTARIDQLERALSNAGFKVPHPEPGEGTSGATS